MSKQVEKRDKTLYIHTREDYEDANKIVMVCKGKKAKPFYPVVPTLVTDIEIVKDWTICGYKVDELVKLSMILRENNINELNLKDYNDAFIAGYQRASDEIHKRLEDSVNNMMRTIYNEQKGGL